MKKTLLVTALFAGACAGARPPGDGATPVAGATIQDAMRAVGGKLAENASGTIAVFPFPERGGGPTLLGEYVADKLIVALGSGGKVHLVERGRLEALRAEQAMASAGELDDRTAASIGNMAGADAVVVGTLTKLASTWELSVRVLGATDAQIRAVAEASFDAGSVPDGLAGTPVGRGAAEKKVASSVAAGSPSAKAGFSEDFAAVADGALPKGWITDDQVGVVSEGQYRVLKWLKGGTHQVTIPNADLPDDFEIEMLVFYQGAWAGMTLKLGAVSVNLYERELALSNADKARIDEPRDKWTTLTLKKSGNVFKGLVNGTVVSTSRISTYELPSSVVFEANAEKFLLRKISARAAP